MRVVMKARGGSIHRTIPAGELRIEQGKLAMGKGKPVVLDVQEPSDTNIAVEKVTVTLKLTAPDGIITSASHAVPITPAKTRGIAFPLHGRWIAANARGDLHCIGTQFGFDLVHQNDMHFHKNPPAGRVPLRKFRSFGRRLYSPVSGTVVTVKDGRPDLRATLTDSTYPNGVQEGPKDRIAGNYMVLRTTAGDFVLLAHIMRGTIRVSPGDKIAEGDCLARVGNSGNTSGPHLHIEMLGKKPDMTTLGTVKANESGIPFGFRVKSCKLATRTHISGGIIVPGKEEIIIAS